jgi:hypothetical protein
LESLLPRITVVTPSLNQGEFLEDCIRSVLGQGYPNLEFIVMDGGSRDGSVEVIKRYEAHLAYTESGPDGGQYAAVAAGFRRARGEILCWMNADDKFHPRALFKVAYVFAERPDVEWITGRPTAFARDGSLMKIGRAQARSRREFLGRTVPLIGGTVPLIQQESTFWRRGLWERAGGEFRPDLAYAADFELWMRFFRLAPLCTVDALLAGFRQHGNQRSVGHRAEYDAEIERVVREERQRCPWGSVPADRVAPAVLGLDPRKVEAYLAQAGYGVAGPEGELDAERDHIIDYLLGVQDTLRKQNRELAARLRMAGLMSAGLRRLWGAIWRRSPGKA